MSARMTAKIFQTGRSQAVRLPAAFRFHTDEVFIRRDEATGDIVLSARPDDWEGFFTALSHADVPVDFLDREELSEAAARDPLKDLGPDRTRS